jgi:hypothetical protein
LQITREEASQWCEQIGAQYHEGSAKEDVHVTKAFLEAARAGLRQVRRLTSEMYVPGKTIKRRVPLMFNMFIFDDKRYITPYSTKNTHWKIQDISS